MPVRILKRKTLYIYCEKYSDAKSSLLAWHDLVSKRQYDNHADLKNDFPTADYVGGNRYVFNIKGNRFRLIVSLNFHVKLGYVKWFGPHAEYEKINAGEVKYADPCH
ncbi:type II toxin-antitoxin system HigB family toxin [Desulfovibrio inopinatus]|uniref:type II toxin-antitoxin system HigB family toxin n=1 Tax=Desulfovibrio inopinatus TaxID=102109 RepID=UPI003CCB7D52